MSREIRPDYSQEFLLPPSIEDWLPAEHPARFVRDFVDSLDLVELGFRDEAQHQGRPRYSDELLLKVWILGYFNEIRSSRKLERACREMVGFIWLTTMNAPDHNTLWRFLSRQEDAIKSLFAQTAVLAQQSGLLGMKTHALDGTKIKGRGSRNAVVRKRALERALAAEEARIAEFMESVKQAEDEEDGQYQLKGDLADCVERKRVIQEHLEDLEAIKREAKQTTDPEAREQKCGDGKHFGYNAQVVIDVESGVVVAADVTNDQNDMQQLEPMTSQVKENLGATAEETLADSGYVTLRQMGEVHAQGINATLNLPSKYIGDREKSPFHTCFFKYDEKRNVVICPIGKELVSNGTKRARWDTYMNRVFRCPFAKHCPEKSRCCPNARTRTILISPFHKALEAQRKKATDSDTQTRLLRLRPHVEHFFGQHKGNSEFRRFSGWGLSGARLQWFLLCLVHNLKKIRAALLASTPSPSATPPFSRVSAVAA